MYKLLEINRFLAAPVPLPGQDSTLTLAIVLMAISLLCLGAFSRYKIFALFSSAIFLHLAVSWESHPPLGISMAGLVLFSLYIAFWGGNDE